MANMKKILAKSGIAAILLSLSTPLFAVSDPYEDNVRRRGNDVDERPRVSAPEIDVTAGTKGIALLVAGLLLAAEGLRRRR